MNHFKTCIYLKWTNPQNFRLSAGDFCSVTKMQTDSWWIKKEFCEFFGLPWHDKVQTSDKIIAVYDCPVSALSIGNAVPFLSKFKIALQQFGRTAKLDAATLMSGATPTLSKCTDYNVVITLAVCRIHMGRRIMSRLHHGVLRRHARVLGRHRIARMRILGRPEWFSVGVVEWLNGVARHWDLLGWGTKTFA